MQRQSLLKIFAVIAFVFSIFSFPSFAFDNNEGQKVEVRLLSEVETVQAGEPFYVAVQQIITPNWHTYWRNPGDSGLPTTIKWDLPSGASAGEIIWPTPSRYKTGDLTNYGYSNEVLLLTKITPPKSLLPGAVLNLRAEVDWLACEEICIPESGEVSISLPITDQAGGLSQHAAKFSQTRENIPSDTDIDTTLELTDTGMILNITPIHTLSNTTITEAYFYNDDGVSVPHAAPQKMTIVDDILTLKLQKGDRKLKMGDMLTGVLAVTSDQGRQSFNLKARATETVAALQSTPSNIINDEQGTTTLWTALLFAFLGGLALNLMPCVFPVLSMKALSLVKHAHEEDQKQVRLGGLMYLLGVLATFTALAAFIIILRATGEKVGWGAQLQSPSFVLITAYVLFVIGYMLSGALDIGSSLMGVGGKWAQRHGLLGSFFTGVLAVIVATPCTAPLMGAAIYFALTQPLHISFLVIEALGFGLALPYLILTFNPRLLRFLPKPGIWMETFKQFLAFPMFGAAIWLVWVLSQQTGSTGVLLSLSGMGFIAFGLWVYGTLSHDRKKGIWHAVKIITAVLSVLLALSFTQTIRMAQIQGDDVSLNTDKDWEVFSLDRLDEARANDEAVFVNMTASWCITCLANERVALSSDMVKDYFKDNGIVYLKGDWTNRDPIITNYIKSFGRSGVPLYVYYPPAGEGVLLPQLLTPDTILSKIKKANL